MPPAATVIIPTHEHGELLARAAASAQAQSVESLEIAIVGDGVDDATREVARELAAGDDRVRFVDAPKGERHGEAQRHRVVQEAAGELVLYLADDDVWLPDHVETMRELLADADFAHTLPLYVEPGGGLGIWPVDLGREQYRDLLIDGENRIPLSCAGHTAVAYRRLPRGWNPAPADVPTDLHMWRQWLLAPGMRFASGTRPTVLHFPSPDRRDRTLEQRAAELDSWRSRLATPDGERRLLEPLFQAAHAEALRRDAEALQRRDEAGRLYAALAASDNERDGLAAERERLATERERLAAENDALDRRLAQLHQTRAWRLVTAWWRLRSRTRR